jgi:hypothetical protein
MIQQGVLFKKMNNSAHFSNKYGEYKEGKWIGCWEERLRAVEFSREPGKRTGVGKTASPGTSK